MLIDYVNWFKTLPIYFENENFRVVHAQWKPDHIEYLKQNRINDFSKPGFLFDSSQKDRKEFQIVECLLKGEEVDIPGVSFHDKDGNERCSYRVKWWWSGENLSCEDSLFEFKGGGGKLPISLDGYNEYNSPVFFGHYWLKNPQPILQQSNVCCLDFSVAKQGVLAAYQWNGEVQLNADNFCHVGSVLT